MPPRIILHIPLHTIAKKSSPFSLHRYIISTAFSALQMVTATSVFTVSLVSTKAAWFVVENRRVLLPLQLPGPPVAGPVPGPAAKVLAEKTVADRAAGDASCAGRICA